MNHVKLTLGNPVIISQAPPDIRDWGPWQFPLLERIADGRLHARFHINADSAASYGKPVGHALSADSGQSWSEVNHPDFEGGIECRNGDRFRIKVRPPYPQSEMLPKEEPVSIIYSYGRKTCLYRPEAFPPEARVWYFERLSKGSPTWIEEVSTVLLPGETIRTVDGVVPRPVFWRMRISPGGQLWGITYIHLNINDLTRRTYSPVFCISNDSGRTFEYLSHIAYQPIPEIDPLWDKRAGFGEPDITFAPDGSVFCLLRTTDGNGIGPAYWCRSTDGGKTWTKPAYFDERGVWPSLLTLDNGVTLAGYGRPGLFLRASADPSCLVWGSRIAVVEPKEYQTDTCSYCDIIALSEDSAYIIYSDFNYPNREGIPVKTILGRKITTQFS